MEERSDPLPGAHGEPGAGCVFCHPEVQPPALAETAHVRLVPDKYPLLPGHLLVITREHLACLGAASAEVVAEVEAMAARARAFLVERYGAPLTWENGVAGQSVFHAHLHLIPKPAALELPPTDGAGGWSPAGGLQDLREHHRRHGHYHYVELGAERRIMTPDGELIRRMRGTLARAAGIKPGDGRFVRATTPADVEEVARRWGDWAGNPAGLRAPR